MAHFSWLLESGEGSWELENSSGNWLIENQEGEHGIELSGTHASQVLQTRKPKLSPTKLIIQLKSDLITRIAVNIPSISLLPLGIFSEKLRQAFVIPTGHLKEKLSKYLQEEVKIMKYESFLDKYGELGILSLIKRMLQWKK